MSDYPTIRPRLLLDFANSKKLDRRITFRRSSTGTYVGADGLIKTAGIDEPRFDHDPVTGVCKGLLVEEARTNAILNSENLSSSTRTARNALIQTNAILAPNNTLTASKIIEDNSDNRFREMDYTGGGISTLGTGNITVSIFVKKAERDVILFGNYSSAPSVWVAFNLTTKTFFTVAGYTQASSYGYQEFNNGWYRVWYSVNLTVNSTTRIDVITGVDEAFTSYTGNGTAGIYVWGQCVEAGSFPTSYIPTVASTVTRSADLASITGTNFSSWYNQSEGTLFINALSRGSTGNNFLAALNLTSAGGNTFADVLEQSTSVRLSVYNNSTIYQVTPSTSGVTAGSIRKAALALKTGNYGAALNGIISARGESATAPPSFDRLLIMNYPSFGTANGTVSRIAYWPKRLPDAQLQALTRR